MYQLKVNDMTCGHCVNRITQTVKAIDPAARVDANLEQKIVRIDSTHKLAELTAAMAAAGYPAQTV
jgi:copper chaperone CopZ